MILEFDEEDLSTELARLPHWSRGAFSASCAQRLIRVCDTFARARGGIDQTQLVDQAREYVWTHILVDPEPEKTDELLDGIMSLIPNDEEPNWTPLTSYAEDGLSALAYCLRCLQSGCDPQEAAWAARRLYEAVYQFVIDSDEISSDEPGGDTAVLRSVAIQTELARQARDLADLRSAVGSASPDFLEGLRTRSTHEQAITLMEEE